jgi:hypothetical protein
MSIAPIFSASLISASLTFVFKLRQSKKAGIRDAVLEALFSIPFGTLLGFLAMKLGVSEAYVLISASAGGMFGTKLYNRFSEKIETFELDDLDINDPLSILNNKTQKTEPMTPKNYFFGIGVNHLNKAKYNGFDGKLGAPERDIDALEKLSNEKGFETFKILKTENATCENVRSTMYELSDTLRKGDKLIISYSGHGGQAKNAANRNLETFCFYDGQMADFEMLNMIAALPKGIEVICIFDCCHSGGFNAKSLQINGLAQKTLPIDIAKSIDNGDVAQSIKMHRPAKMHGGQSIRFLFACQKNEVAYDGPKGGNSLFTQAILKIDQNDENATYTAFQDQLTKQCVPYQTPRFLNRPLSIDTDVKHFN